MTKEEKVNKIIEMSKELMMLQLDDISDRELDQLYSQTKFALQTAKELKGESKEGEL